MRNRIPATSGGPVKTAVVIARTATTGLTCLSGASGFFDHMSHEWTMQFVRHRVADQRILRLIQKWLKAGVSEDGEWSETKVGTPQGAAISPLLANVYLH